MPSTFTDNTGIEKIGDGEQSGLWGQTTNLNFDIVDRALNGVVPVQLLSTSVTLTTSSGGLSDGQAAAILFTGSVAGPATVTIAPNTAQKTYLVRNESNQPLTITQGSGGDVAVPVGKATTVACTGEGATARVFEVGIAEINFATGVLGTLPIVNGGTGTTSTQFANLTTNVTGTLPVANGGTGRSTITTGALVLGSGTGQVGQLVGTGIGQIPQWNGSAWAAGNLPSSGVLGVSATAPLSSTGGATPNLSLTGIVPIANGGTGTDSTQFASLTTNVTGTLPIANGGTGTTSAQFTNLTTNVTDVLPVANGGTGRSTLTSGSIVLGNGTDVVGQLTGTTEGQVPTWTGSTWAAGSNGVTSVTASAPLASSGGATPNLSLTGTIALGNGGTGSTTASGARTNLGLGTMATQNSTSVSISGGSISNVSISNASGVVATSQFSGLFASSEQQIGVGQTWQNVYSSRSSNVIYQNTTGRPIVVSCSTSALVSSLRVSANGSVYTDAATRGNSSKEAIVPHGHYYFLYNDNNNIGHWTELR